MRNSAIKLRDSVIKQGDSFLEVPDSIDGIRMTAEALLQVALQQQQENEARKSELAEYIRKSDKWLEESNRRFYTLLDEVRYLNRRGDRNNGKSQE